MALRCKYVRLALPTLLASISTADSHAGTSGSLPELDERDDPPRALCEPLRWDILGLNCRYYEETVACACGSMAGCTRVRVVVDGTSPVRYVMDSNKRGFV
jgi:hypothetical protein